MKKFFLLGVIIPLLFAACSRNGGITGSNFDEALIGTWKGSVSNYGFDAEYTFVFEEAGAFNMSVATGLGHYALITANGIWSTKTRDVLTLNIMRQSITCKQNPDCTLAPNLLEEITQKDYNEIRDQFISSIYGQSINDIINYDSNSQPKGIEETNYSFINYNTVKFNIKGEYGEIMTLTLSRQAETPATEK